MRTEITDFIRERLAEDRLNRHIDEDYYHNILELVKLHEETWPVLAQEHPKYEPIKTIEDYNQVAIKLTQHIEWHTRDSYIKRFGTDPPLNPVVLAFARIWKTHANFQEAWA